MALTKGEVGPCMAPGGVDNLIIFEYPCAATQYFYLRGTKFIYLESTNSRITMCLTATTYVDGWAMAPVTNEGSSANTLYWTSAGAGVSKIPTIMAAANPGCVYRVPTTASGGLSLQARIGESCDIVGVNDGTIQYVTPGTADIDILHFVGLDPRGSTDACLVTINSEKMQLDTA